MQGMGGDWTRAEGEEGAAGRPEARTASHGRAGASQQGMLEPEGGELRPQS